MRTNLPFLPFARSYWVAPGQLLGGFYPGDRDPAVASGKLNALLDSGVTHIVNLMEPQERDHARRLFEPYRETFRHLAMKRGQAVCLMQRSVPDLGVPSVEQMRGTLDVIDSAISTGGCVYVHCWGGRGRTGTVMGCWLARHGESDPHVALRLLTAHARTHFGSVPETVAQKRFVAEWRCGL